jgi:hypothetical protein
MNFVIFGSFDNTFATTWVMPGLYINVKSYYRNNNNHLTIIPYLVVCWSNRPMPYDPHKRQTYCPTNNVWTCAKQKNC